MYQSPNEKLVFKTWNVGFVMDLQLLTNSSDVFTYFFHEFFHEFWAVEKDNKQLIGLEKTDVLFSVGKVDKETVISTYWIFILGNSEFEIGETISWIRYSIFSSFFSRDEVSLLHVFFKSEFIVQYKRDQLYGIEDLVCKSGFAIFAHKSGKKYLGQKNETCHSFTMH